MKQNEKKNNFIYLKGKGPLKAKLQSGPFLEMKHSFKDLPRAINNIQSDKHTSLSMWQNQLKTQLYAILCFI